MRSNVSAVRKHKGSPICPPPPRDSGTEGDPAEKGLILHFREACIGEIG